MDPDRSRDRAQDRQTGRPRHGDAHGGGIRLFRRARGERGQKRAARRRRPARRTRADSLRDATPAALPDLVRRRRRKTRETDPEGGRLARFRPFGGRPGGVPAPLAARRDRLPAGRPGRRGGLRARPPIPSAGAPAAVTFSGLRRERRRDGPVGAVEEPPAVANDACPMEARRRKRSRSRSSARGWRWAPRLRCCGG